MASKDKSGVRRGDDPSGSESGAEPDVNELLSGLENSSQLPRINSQRLLPARVIRVEATRELLRRMTDQMNPSQIWSILLRVEPQTNLLKRLKESLSNLQKMPERSDRLKDTSTETRTLNETDISDAYECFELAFSHFDTVTKAFPGRSDTRRTA